MCSLFSAMIEMTRHVHHVSLISCIYTRARSNQIRNKSWNTIQKVNTMKNTRPSIKQEVKNV